MGRGERAVRAAKTSSSAALSRRHLKKLGVRDSFIKCGVYL